MYFSGATWLLISLGAPLLLSAEYLIETRPAHQPPEAINLPVIQDPPPESYGMRPPNFSKKFPKNFLTTFSGAVLNSQPLNEWNLNTKTRYFLNPEEGMAHESQENHFLPAQGIGAFLIPSGLFPIHLPRKFARHPSLSTRPPAKALSYGHPR